MQQLPELRRLLVARGYQEAVTYSFIDPKQFELFNPGVEPLLLANPVSNDMAAMRSSLWPGLVKALSHNLNRQQDRVRLFESGLRFVGPSGAGKSTIANLIPRFYHHDKGQILIDGVEVEEYKLLNLRKHIAQVTQHVTLFSEGQASDPAKLASETTTALNAAVEQARKVKGVTVSLGSRIIRTETVIPYVLGRLFSL